MPVALFSEARTLAILDAGDIFQRGQNSCKGFERLDSQRSDTFYPGSYYGEEVSAVPVVLDLPWLKWSYPQLEALLQEMNLTVFLELARTWRLAQSLRSSPSSAVALKSLVQSGSRAGEA